MGVVAIVVMMLLAAYAFKRDAAPVPTAKDRGTLRRREAAASTAPAVAVRRATSVPVRQPAGSDPKINTYTRRLEGGVPGDARIVVTVQSLYRCPLEKVLLTVLALDESGRRLDSQSTSRRYMPPLGMLTATVDFTGLPEDTAVKFSCTAVAVKAPEGSVYLAIDEESCSIEQDDDANTITVIGRARNTTSATLTDVKVVADFHTRQGALLCTVAGSLEGVASLVPGQSASYEIAADGNSIGFMVQTAGRHLALRLVGTKR